MSHFLSPLRYPGGKGRISKYFSQIIKNNDLIGGHYAEPYAGGCGVAFHLLMNGYVNHIHINDLNYPLFCFWHSVLNETESLCKKIQRCKISVDAWKRHKYKVTNSSEYSMLDIGFAFLFLNRTNRSGIINGGIIGGYAQHGDWKMDCRFNKKALISKIRKIGAKSENITLYNLDAQTFMSDIVCNMPSKTLIYIDPPYFKKGQRLYDNFYNPEDHSNIAKTIKNLNHNWVVSYDNTPEITVNYLEFRQLQYSLNYSAAKKYLGSELMVYSKGLVIPEPNDPITAKAA